MDCINMLVAEPDPIRRAGLASFIEKETDLRLVGMGTDYIEACQSLSPDVSIDVMLLNLDNPRMASAREWSLLRALLPKVRIAGLTNGTDECVLESVLAGGVIALQHVLAEPAVICRAIRLAAAGMTDFNPDLLQRMKIMLMRPSCKSSELESMPFGNGADERITPGSSRKEQDGLEKRLAGEEDSAESSPESLSPRELQVLELIARGLDNTQISNELGISISTTKYHIGNIYAKLRVRSRIQAVLVGLERGWVTME